MLNDHGYIWWRNWYYFAAQKWVGGLGPWVSALPMGSMDVFDNYIFEISVKNGINEPEHIYLVEFLKLNVP
jgi:hypothetical protein